MANQSNPKSVEGKPRGLRFVTLEIRGQQVKALVDTDASHNFITPEMARRLGIRVTTQVAWMKPASGDAQPIQGVAWGVRAKIGVWTGKMHFSVVPLDDNDIILGMEFFRKTGAAIAPKHEHSLHNQR
ncbi:UBA domain-containing protein Mud1-like [Bidens hawaiensis]|uniref:UBA domain-containing protein Mud1-like n=1 Tax=Bidens hawaiensis TaxID=980011 RepID=UPI00404B5F1F